MSKGSNPRPIQVPKNQYDINWERIFGVKKTKKDRSDQAPKETENKKNK